VTSGKRIALAIAGACSLACGKEQPREVASTAACPPEALRVVENFGARLREVSTLAPDSVIQREATRAYAATVSPALLDEWRATPRKAPGRAVSNPWPARIEIRDTSASGPKCKVGGVIVYVTTSDTASAVDTKPVTLEVSNVAAAGWRITSYDGPETAAAPEAKRESPPVAADTTPAAVLRSYYAAIDARRYRDAYLLWSGDGSASGKSLAGFTAGFAETKSVRAAISDSIRMEGAAGSQYATVPVTVDAVLKDGTTQHFTGTYTLRRAMVDGATAKQRAWHIYTARISR
jgi:hypothetical protein